MLEPQFSRFGHTLSFLGFRILRVTKETRVATKKIEVFASPCFAGRNQFPMSTRKQLRAFSPVPFPIFDETGSEANTRKSRDVASPTSVIIALDRDDSRARTWYTVNIHRGARGPP